MCSSSTYRNWTCRCRAGFFDAADERARWCGMNEGTIYRFFSSDSRAVDGPRDEKSIEGKWIFVEREEKCSFSSPMQLEREISQNSDDALSSRNPIYIFILLLSRISVSSRLFEPRHRCEKERDATKPIWIGTKHRMKTFNFLQRFSPSLRKTRWWSTSSADDVQFAQNEAWHFLLIMQYLTRNRLLPSAKERGYCVIDCLIIPASSSSSSLLSLVNLISNTSIFPHWRYNV